MATTINGQPGATAHLDSAFTLRGEERRFQNLLTIVVSGNRAMLIDTRIPDTNQAPAEVIAIHETMQASLKVKEPSGPVELVLNSKFIDVKAELPRGTLYRFTAEANEPLIFIVKSVDEDRPAYPLAIVTADETLVGQWETPNQEQHLAESPELSGPGDSPAIAALVFTPEAAGNYLVIVGSSTLGVTVPGWFELYLLKPEAATLDEIGNLVAGATQSWQLELQSPTGFYVIAQPTAGLDISLALIDANGQPAAEANDAGSGYAETLLLTPETSENFTLEVASEEQTAGSYQVIVAPLPAEE
ncbi:MAG: hypothetical protein L0332_13715 [Chloroflexi bacterium]|nr:hypothetical protein [Chloroflexota bacterium]MCI0580157.1 hypothetical protein [Chloroflexota bacterium]MCI0649651.1 hypothetical protein [Chloroflexota bacterium]MCI0727761.1 hypothetical protein [Chloroflexota bacterium]